MSDNGKKEDVAVLIEYVQNWCMFWGFWVRAVGLTHWGRVTHICVSELPIIGSDNGLSPGRRQAIIWTNAGILLIHTLGTNFSEISEIHTTSFKKMRLKMSSAKWRPFCLGLNVLSVTTTLLGILLEHLHLHNSWIYSRYLEYSVAVIDDLGRDPFM